MHLVFIHVQTRVIEFDWQFVKSITKLLNSMSTFVTVVCMYVLCNCLMNITQVQHWLLQFSTELAERLSEDMKTVSLSCLCVASIHV